MIFPKKLKIVKQSAREQDPRYVYWIHSWACCVPGCDDRKKWPVHAHHSVRRSQLGSDRTCVPLCYDHHVGHLGVHQMGVLEWEKRFNVDLTEVVKKYNSLYDSGENGPYMKRLPSFEKAKLGKS